MKKYILISLLVALSGAVFSSCGYLDIVPEESASEKDAFADQNAAERYLYSCYGFFPNERRATFLYMSGEVVCANDYAFMTGSHSASNVGDLEYWDRLYAGIRRCYTLINNIDKVPRMPDDVKKTYIAEARFLIAFYHSHILKTYGPVILVDREFPTDMPKETYPARSSYDDCVKWISDRFDEAEADLLMSHTASAFGRATKILCRAAKARMLLYAASPLFNGNAEFYSDFKNYDGTPLMPLTFDKSKWQKAYDAAVNAIELAEDNGIVLYKDKVPTADMPYPADPTEWTLRTMINERNSSEVIWADGRREGIYDTQNGATPRDPSGGNSANYLAPSLAMVMNFYTENGLPIDQDPAYFKGNEFFQMGSYDGLPTAKMHLRREPRFYAWISFHNGWYEMQRGTDKRIRTAYREKDPFGRNGATHDITLTGYLIKKAVNPQFHSKNGFVHYPWAYFRLTELYLNAAEAAVEIDDLTHAKFYLNEIRKRAGIPTVETSWEGIATLNQTKLREIIRHERTIELFFENHYGWDIRRWKVAEPILNFKPFGMNVFGETDEEFTRKTQVDLLWHFESPKNYLLPIRSTEVYINPKMVQNPGY